MQWLDLNLVEHRYKVDCTLYSMVDETKVVKVTKDGSTSRYEETAVEVRDEGSTHIMTNDDLKVKAVRAGDAVTDLVDSAFEKAITAVRTRTDELIKSGVLEPGYAAARKDSRDISRLGPLVTDLAATFEDTITMIREHPYDEQIDLLIGYQKLLEEQIQVINSRIQFAKRLR